MSLEQYPTALRFRDLITRMIVAQLEKERPRYKYAVVTSINRTNSTCTVRFPGETVDATVNMFSIQPAAVGQTVQIDGIASDRFVSGVKGQAYTIGSGVPVGAWMPFGGDTAPIGYLFGRGGTQLIANYPELATVYGTKYGGNGTTTFGIPDLQRRMPMGLDVAGGVSAYDTLGELGGSIDAALPSHTHTVRSNSGTTDYANTGHLHGGGTGGITVNHVHSYDIGDIAGASGGLTRQGYSLNARTTGTVSADHGHNFTTNDQDRNHYHAMANDSSGVAPAGLNMPPYIIVNFIIKT